MEGAALALDRSPQYWGSVETSPHWPSKPPAELSEQASKMGVEVGKELLVFPNARCANIATILSLSSSKCKF